MAKAPVLLTAEEAGKRGGRGKRGKESIPLSKGPTVDRLAARLKRDHPEIAVPIANGEFKSIRQAALETGIVRPMRSIPIDTPDNAIRALRRICWNKRWPGR